MKDGVRFFRIGTEVVMPDGLAGIVKSIRVLSNVAVEYQVAWREGKVDKKEWFDSTKLTQGEDRSSRAAFAHPFNLRDQK